MPLATYGQQISLGSISLNYPVEIDAEHPNPYVIDLPHGHAGTVTTYTDGTHGVVTLGAGHGLVSTDVVDVFFAGGICYGMVATVSGNAITLAGGAGSAFPATTTPVVVTKQVAFEIAMNGTKLLLAYIVAQFSTVTPGQVDEANIVLSDAEPVIVYQRVLSANRPKSYDLQDSQEVNPFNAAIVAGVASNGSAVDACTLYALFHNEVI